ncbi:UDP-glucose iridoid glucosyltransferase-like [Solanum tuberosum]|uniref:Glycosyltransferase n=1 Tax=Solanum tuberosum TaxID=4113 RepID=M1ARG6_SOLTU|nr:PREDICTED: UDP-glucose iridoid glucosyltransferase-like [Solanum tuberosum]
MKVERKQSVVLVPFLLQGHLTPMLQLGSILRSQGFSVIVAHTQHNTPNYSNHPEFIFHSMDDGLKGIDMSLPSVKSIYRMNESCKAPLRNYLVRMMEQEQEQEQEQDVQGDQLTCIIYDNNMFFVDDVATQLRIPSIVLHTFSAACMNSMVTIFQQPEKYFPFEDSQLLDPLPELHPLRFKDVPIPAFNNTVAEHILDFFRAMSDIGSSVATIWNTMQDLESSMLLRLQEHYKVPFFPIGPLHKMAPLASSTSILEEDNSCIEWLDRQAPNSVLYVSLGSLVRIDDKELIETAWGLANSDQPFLWVIRPGSVSGFQCPEVLPDGFEKMVGERGRIVKWAPQKQVLAHPAVAGFFTHCGWNSTLESILEEVPLICRPFVADQPVTARYLSQIYKVGFELEVIERTVIEKTVRKLMLSEEGKDVKKRVVDMKQNIVAAMQIDGTSHKNLNDLVDFISALPSRPAPPTPVFGAIMSSNHITSKCIIESGSNF